MYKMKSDRRIPRECKYITLYMGRKVSCEVTKAVLGVTKQGHWLKIYLSTVLHSTLTSCHRHVHVAWYFEHSKYKVCLVWDYSHRSKVPSTRLISTFLCEARLDASDKWKYFGCIKFHCTLISICDTYLHKEKISDNCLFFYKFNLIRIHVNKEYLA
jgi:hypothetical protein